METAFLPGALLLLNKWYKRSELSQRMAYLVCGMFISYAFGSLIASVILDIMDGVLGHTAWRWLFFVEGGLTVLVAIFALFILPDYPETESISWLTPAEHALARTRMIEDSAESTSQKPLSVGPREDAMAGLVMALTDWKVWFFAFMIFLEDVTTSFSLYFPTLAATMGYNPTITLLLCAPPWLVGAIWVLWFSRHSDRMSERCMHTVTLFSIGIGGSLLAMSTMNTVVRYLSLFLMAQNSPSIFLFAWASSTVSDPPAKRAVALAFINTLSQGGNVVGSYVWPRSWGPTYNKSFAICIATSLLCTVMCLWLRKKLLQLNEEMDLAEEQGLRTGKRWRYHV